MNRKSLAFVHKIIVHTSFSPIRVILLLLLVSCSSPRLSCREQLKAKQNEAIEKEEKYFVLVRLSLSQHDPSSVTRIHMKYPSERLRCDGEQYQRWKLKTENAKSCERWTWNILLLSAATNPSAKHYNNKNASEGEKRRSEYKIKKSELG